MKAMLSLASLAVMAAVSMPSHAQKDSVSYIVLLNQGANASQGLDKKVSKAGGTVKFVMDEIGVAVVESSNSDFQSKLSRAAGIQAVAYSLPVQMEDTSPRLGPTADGDNPGADEYFYPLQWGLDAVHAPQAWMAGARGAGARVAVLDSGIDHDNVDLAPNLNAALSRSFLPCVFGLNCDGEMEDWRIREPSEFFDEGPTFFNHGTHVSGTIAAADNGWGGIGVAPDAEIVAVKVCTEFDTFCLDEAILPGIVYAANIGADVINMSLGGVSDRNPSELCKLIKELELDIPCGQIVSSDRAVTQAYRRAFSYARSRNTTVIVSAGNSALNADKGSLFFAFSDLPNVLGISALGPVGSALPAVLGDAPPVQLAGPDTLAYYSNYGRSIIDFGAPGGNTYLFDVQVANGQDPGASICEKAGFYNYCFIFDAVLSNGPGPYFFWAEGTSMAAPHATGVAAIIVGLNGGNMSPQSLRTAMKRYADDLGAPGHDPVFGDGRVNAGAATE